MDLQLDPSKFGNKKRSTNLLEQLHNQELLLLCRHALIYLKDFIAIVVMPCVTRDVSQSAMS